MIVGEEGRTGLDGRGRQGKGVAHPVGFSLFEIPPPPGQALGHLGAQVVSRQDQGTAACP